MRAVYARLHFRMHVVDLHGDRVNSYDLTSFEFIIASMWDAIMKTNDVRSFEFTRSPCGMQRYN